MNPSNRLARRGSTPVVLCALLFAVSAQGMQKNIPGVLKVARIQLAADAVNPATPVAGQAATVGYSITSIVAATGIVTATYNDAALGKSDGSAAAAVTVTPGTPLTGSFVIPSPTAGAGEVIVRFTRPDCVGGPFTPARIINCRNAEFDMATLSLNVIEPTITVRIAGTSYAVISRPDDHDGATANSGYQCVVHNPGCGWWGNDGTDRYFTQKSLPAGATLVGTDFDQFWPLGIDSATGAGAWTWLNSSGTYYAHLAPDPSHPTVNWNNTCAGGFAGKNLFYSISFRISMPKGTDLGEPAVDPSTPMTCALGGYSPVPLKISDVPTNPVPSGWAGQVLFCNPSATAITEYLHLRATLKTPYANAQGSAAPMVEDNLPLQFAPSGSVGSTSSFRTTQIYKQGTWQITSAFITPAPTPATNPQGTNPAMYPHAPLNAQLPDAAGGPVLDFRGGSCL